MPFVYNVPFISIMISLIGAIITPLFKRNRVAPFLNGFILSFVFIINTWLLFVLFRAGESFTYMMGHFPAPFGNELKAGPLEAIMASAFSLVMFLSLIGGRDWIVRDILKGKDYLFYVMQNLLFSSMLALIYSNDIFTGYVFIEINTIAACSIIMIRDSDETITATIKYLIMSLLGSGLMLFGISMLYYITGHLLMEDAHTAINALALSGDYRIPLTVVMGLMALALCVKSALYPFHSWLPDAHSAATTSSSAILSGLVLKGYIIFLIKLIHRTFGVDVFKSLNVSDVLFILGVFGMIFGSINALRESHLKRMVAYSSVAQIGYIFMGIGMDNPLGMMAACYHIIFHAFTKPMLFISGSALANVSGHSYHLGRLRGAAHKNKIAGFAFSIGSLSMIGIPILAGFPSKMYLVMSAVDTGILRMPLVFVSIAISTVLNALYYVPALISIWRRPSNEEPLHEDLSNTSKGAGLLFSISMIAFMVLNILVGTRFNLIRQILERGLELL